MQVQIPMMRKEFITGTIDCESADMICHHQRMVSMDVTLSNTVTRYMARDSLKTQAEEDLKRAQRKG